MGLHRASTGQKVLYVFEKNFLNTCLKNFLYSFEKQSEGRFKNFIILRKKLISSDETISYTCRERSILIRKILTSA